MRAVDVLTVLVLAAALAGGALLLLDLLETRFERTVRAELRRRRERIPRLRFAARREIRERVLAAPLLRSRLASIARRLDRPPDEIERKARAYLDEIIPAFSLVSYNRVAAVLARRLVSSFYDLAVSPGGSRVVRESIPSEASVVYVANHRSNFDYVLLTRVLDGTVAISYAVGEWARVWPLEAIFKSFGSYFVRRGFRDEIYHAALAGYVRLITREGVSQGVFLEGGISRSGSLQPAKLGLLSYALSTLDDPDGGRPLYFVPCGINYDRVLEDRVLRAESEGNTGTLAPLRRIRRTLRFLGRNAEHLLRKRFRRYGLAAVAFGPPVDARAYLASLHLDPSLSPALRRREEVRRLAQLLMRRIGQAIPALPVPILAAAMRRHPEPGVSSPALAGAMEAVRDRVRSVGGWEPGSGRPAEAVLSDARRVLEPRRILLETPGGWSLPAGDRGLLEFYARSLEPLLEAPDRALPAVP
jgi:glycerol-3-phosphate O-acyltransferase